MCLKFAEFEAGCAYKPVAYKKKTCSNNNNNNSTSSNITYIDRLIFPSQFTLLTSDWVVLSSVTLLTPVPTLSSSSAPKMRFSFALSSAALSALTLKILLSCVA